MSSANKNRPAAELSSGAVEVSQAQHLDDDAWVDRRGGDRNSFVFCSDPDGNGWVVPENSARS
jgi:hypothetical protein